jgi:hypothetical protein
LRFSLVEQCCLGELISFRAGNFFVLKTARGIPANISKLSSLIDGKTETSIAFQRHSKMPAIGSDHALVAPGRDDIDLHAPQCFEL